MKIISLILTVIIYFSVCSTASAQTLEIRNNILYFVNSQGVSSIATGSKDEIIALDPDTRNAHFQQPPYDRLVVLQERAIGEDVPTNRSLFIKTDNYWKYVCLWSATYPWNGRNNFYSQVETWNITQRQIILLVIWTESRVTKRVILNY